MTSTTLILDIDGVLITTPIWKADTIVSDGYSEFNGACVKNLNSLLGEFDFEIWLSSSRRAMKSLTEFNHIFSNRNVVQPIEGFLPVSKERRSRKEEILSFIHDNRISKFLIIDDDKSLNDLSTTMKRKLVLTEYHKGFDKEKLQTAIYLMNSQEAV